MRPFFEPLEARQHLSVSAPTEAPSELVVSKVKNYRAALNWSDNSSRELGFRIFRSDDNGLTWKLAGQTGSNVDVTYVAVIEGKRNLFRLRAILPKNKLTAFSETVGAWIPPNPPMAVAAAGMNGSRIDVS